METCPFVLFVLLVVLLLTVETTVRFSFNLLVVSFVVVTFFAVVVGSTYISNLHSSTKLQLLVDDTLKVHEMKLVNFLSLLFFSSNPTNKRPLCESAFILLKLM